MDDVLPNQESIKLNKGAVDKKVISDIVESGNITQMVHEAILSVHDMYFACKYVDFTDSKIFSLENM